jgi:hypothetical protein
LSYSPGDTGYSASDDNTTGDPSYSLSGGPAGMSIDSSTGEITWTTSCGDGGTYTDIEVTITDACGEYAVDMFTLTVEECICCDYWIDNPHANWGKPGNRGIHLHAKINSACIGEQATILKVEIYKWGFNIVPDELMDTREFTINDFGSVNQEWLVYERGLFEVGFVSYLKIWLETEDCSPTEKEKVWVVGE